MTQVCRNRFKIKIKLLAAFLALEIPSAAINAIIQERTGIQDSSKINAGQIGQISEVIHQVSPAE